MSERSVPIPRPVWESLLKSCGLRRREWEQLRVRDIRRDATGRIWLHIGEEAGIAAREVPVVGGFEWAICDVLARRFPSTPEEAVSFAEAIATRSPDDFVFSLVPPRLNIDQGRREYASWLYYSLLSSQEQVQDSHTFEAVGEQVRLALGLPRIDATIRRCIRQARVETQRKKQGRRKTRSEWGGGSSRGELVRWPRQHPDLGEQEWQEDGEFVHGYVNGAYYRMVCSRVELEEARTQMQQEAGQPIETGDVWWWLGVAPAEAWFGPFEPVAVFEEDRDAEVRRRQLAVQMVLDPMTTTWYGLGQQYRLLMGMRVRERRALLAQRQREMGVEETHEGRRRFLYALEVGLNPFTATKEVIEEVDLALHKVALPQELSWWLGTYCQIKECEEAEVVQNALKEVLDRWEQEREGTGSFC